MNIPCRPMKTSKNLCFLMTKDMEPFKCFSSFVTSFKTYLFSTTVHFKLGYFCLDVSIFKFIVYNSILDVKLVRKFFPFCSLPLWFNKWCLLLYRNILASQGPTCFVSSSPFAIVSCLKCISFANEFLISDSGYLDLCWGNWFIQSLVLCIAGDVDLFSFICRKVLTFPSSIHSKLKIICFFPSICIPLITPSHYILRFQALIE